MKIKTLGELIEQAAQRFDETDIAYGHGTDNAFDEAAFIALEGLQLPIDELEEHWEAELDKAQQEKLEAIVRARIETRKPASYLLSKAYIQGIPFYVDERVIVPRSFIAEILCHENGFSRIENMKIKNVLDLCTGSGCLAILAALLFPGAKVDAVDLSRDALEVARRNVKDHDLEQQVSLFEGDLFAPLKNKKYDLIITNPPYVDAQDMAGLPAEYRHEPAMALGSGTDGMDITRQILKHAAAHLTEQGGLICEIGNGRDILEAESTLPFLWLDTENSEGEVFWLTRKDLTVK